ncbi:FAD-dependent oxidoreductase [Bacillus methanolicus]|uniref:Rieske 2Fe-2S iron-sulfur protein YhfW n=1 Tax=Bacillus methanolicus (strain MGA3 / ATCC 53907) TaxID=796606 RepID=I3EBS7_BACMM|nr:FAD-dependent oxidoreductase [Bacillus methanolicus]AIE61629.1 Putative Rieske 2Fe-2S iron-sulfur protein YhfW [Bacillus methanolicus MGA3]EIJ83948.1 FAD dependent oxidoreductase [Bacillus methanolicus MGA3]
MAENDKVSKTMPQFPEPYWRKSTNLPSFQKLSGDREADVVIVGGGITGITAAYLLVKEGLQVVLLDAGRILNGTTGHTTAKITAQHGLIYDELINHFGAEKAKLYYQANMDAITFIKNTVKDQQIDCDLNEEDAYIYTNSSSYTQKIINELKAYEKLGIDGEFLSEIPIPVKMKSALVMKKQAQFHPLKYLSRFVEYLSKNNCSIYENTTAVDIEKGEQPVVITRDGHKITCRNVIISSHFPFFEKTGGYFARMYAERSYVLGVKTEKEYPGGMYINAEQPTRSLRYAELDGEKLILFGGESHKTGHAINTIKHYEALEAFAEETFGIKEIPYRWSAQDLITLDKVPYIGPITSNNPNIYVTTGYRKWGMTNGTAAAMLVTDLILKKENRYEKLFTPSRFNADPSLKNLVSQNVQVAKDLIEGKLELPSKHPEDLGDDEGAAVAVNGKRAGAYRDEDGKLHVVDTTCSHMGCELEWNNGERTWDCPCHGSRFSYKGEVIEGPAEVPLKQIDNM